jgi:hypothetical protein
VDPVSAIGLVASLIGLTEFAIRTLSLFKKKAKWVLGH